MIRKGKRTPARNPHSYPSTHYTDPTGKRTPARPEEWEECEDEHGNVFYYNLRTGETRVPED